MSAMDFPEAGRRGVDWDEPSMGLIVRADARRGDYLWVPNTGESTLSKWDAATGTEIAKYHVGLAAHRMTATNSPSRVVVDGHGNCFVATRGLGVVGTVTKIAGDLRDCVDRNMNGMIETSRSRTEILAPGEDECVLWSTSVGPANGLLRALAIGPGTEDEPGGSVWAGVCGDHTGQWRLDWRTGAITQTFNIPRCTYGAVGTSDGNIWYHTPGEGLTPINAMTNMVGTFVPLSAAPAPCRSSYAISADGSGRIWVSDYYSGTAAGYDPAMRAWTCMNPSTAPGGRGGAGTRGITVDTMNNIWMPQQGNPFNFYVWPATAFVPNGVIPGGMVRVLNLGRAFIDAALGADRAGNMWVLRENELIKYNPMTNTHEDHTGPVGTYTYSDFTGAVRRLALREGSYTQDYERCEMGRWTTLRWDASTPGDSTLTFRVKTAATAMGLDAAPTITVAVASRDMSPINLEEVLRMQGMMNLKFLRVTVDFRPGMATPVLRAMSVENRCSPMGAG
jgi:streptogramin lyase